MKIELKKISVNERMSEETTNFVAYLYINGKKIGYCKNNGCGGCTDIHSETPEMNKRIQEAYAYCKTLPKVKFNDKEYEQTLENVIDDLLSDYLKNRDLKKMQKLMLNAILFGIPNGSSYYIVKYTQPLKTIAKMNKLALQARVNRIKAENCKNGVVILNTNLAGLGISL